MKDEVTANVRKNYKKFIEKNVLVIMENDFMSLAVLASKDKFESVKERGVLSQFLIKSGFYYYKDWNAFVRLNREESINDNFEHKKEIITELAEIALARVGN